MRRYQDHAALYGGVAALPNLSAAMLPKRRLAAVNYSLIGVVAICGPRSAAPSVRLSSRDFRAVQSPSSTSTPAKLSTHHVDPAKSYWRNTQKTQADGPGLSNATYVATQMRHMSRLITMVELRVNVLGHYSKQVHLFERLKKVHRFTLCSKTRLPAPTDQIVPKSHKIVHRFDNVTRACIVDEYRAGAPTTELMKRYKIGKGTVLDILKTAGVTMRSQGLAPTDLGRAITLYQAGLSLKQVACHFACDPETIRKALHTAGVRVRKPWERT